MDVLAKKDRDIYRKGLNIKIDVIMTYGCGLRQN